MAYTVPSAFTEFAAKLKPTATQEQTIAERRDRVENFLLAKYAAGSIMPLTEAKVIGSAGRKTLIRPINDIDVFAVFDDSQVWSQYKNDSRQLLYRVREALDEYQVETVGSRGQAVRLFYKDGLHVDITPAFPLYNILFRNLECYVIPRGDGSWLKTDPYKHGAFMVERNQALGNYLKPLVRLLKRWNNVHSNRLKSFHLEMMAQAVFTSLSSNMRENTQVFFRYAGSSLNVNDPAGYSGNLAASLTQSQREAILQSFNTADAHATRALQAENDGQTEESIRQWRIVFGNEFPSYG